MKVLVTGHNGYVGRVLTKILLEKKMDVVGCDINYFPTSFNEELDTIKNLNKDIRKISVEDLENIDGVIHLAGLSNDPLGELNPQLTHEINFLSTVRLAKLSKEAGVERFLFSSSCSTYGKNSALVNEESNLEPLTEYAKSKVSSETEILSMADEKFCPTILRNATVFGYSPGLRLDLVVNNLTASAFVTGKVKLLSDGTAWRPLLHVEDMSRAFLSIIESQVDSVKGEIFNVGNNDDNYTVRQIAEKVQNVVPNSEIEFSDNSNKDSRSYKVDFGKIKNNLGYKTIWSLEKGIKQLYDCFEKEKFTKEDFNDKKFYRLKQLSWLLENNKLNKELFFN